MRKHFAGFQYRAALRLAGWLRRLERRLEPIGDEHQAAELALAEEYVRATGRAVRRAQGREP